MEFGFGFGVEAPHEFRIRQEASDTKGNVNPMMIVLAARLQKQNGVLAGFRKPGGERRTRRACAHDNEIETVQKTRLLDRLRLEK